MRSDPPARRPPHGGGTDLHAARPRAAWFTRRRRTTIRVLAVVGLVAFGLSAIVVLTDVVDPVADERALEPAGSPEAQLGADRPGETVHVVGAVAALLVGGSGLVALALDPQRPGSATHTTAAMLASLAVMGIVGDPDNHGGQAGPFDPALLIFAVPALIAALAAGPWANWHRGGIARPRFLALASMGMPFLWYGVDQALVQRHTWPPLADPHHQAHWYLMAVVAFMIVAVTAGAAIAGSGWRLAALGAALGAVALGAASLAAPAAGSALTPPWAALAIAWGAVALALVRDASRPGRSAASDGRDVLASRSDRPRTTGDPIRSAAAGVGSGHAQTAGRRR